MSDDGSTTATTAEPDDPEVPDTPAKRARLKELKTRATEKVATTRADLEARRSTSSTVEMFFSSLEGDTTAGGGVLAGAVTFRLFLFQIPYTFLFVTVLGAFHEFSLEPTDDRPKGIGGLTAQALHSASDLSGWGRAGAIVAGAFATYLGARGAVKVLWVVHTLVWHLPPSKPRTNRAVAGFVLVVTVALVLSGLVSHVTTDTALGRLLLVVTSDVIYGVVWLFVSRHLPHEPEAGRWDLLPGAVLVAVGTLILHLVTVYWIAYELESKSETYGAIGASLALLLWAYLLGRVITASAVLNHARWHQTHPASGRSAT